MSLFAEGTSDMFCKSVTKLFMEFYIEDSGSLKTFGHYFLYFRCHRIYHNLCFNCKLKGILHFYVKSNKVKIWKESQDCGGSDR